jgi:hypothetical protein
VEEEPDAEGQPPEAAQGQPFGEAAESERSSEGEEPDAEGQAPD